MNLNKTKFLTTDRHETSTITISGSNLPRTERFKYFGSMLSANGELRYRIAAGINATRMKWRPTTGVLCDRRINERLKSKMYRNVVRPVALYGSECWPTIKDNERRLAVMETKMLSWTSGVTRFDHIRNEVLRDGGEEHGAATVSAEPKPSGRGKPLQWWHRETLYRIGLPAVIRLESARGLI